MSYKTFYSEAEIEVSLEEWSDDELLAELAEREVENSKPHDVLLRKIFEAKRNKLDYDALLDEYLYIKLGR